MLIWQALTEAQIKSLWICVQGSSNGRILHCVLQVLLQGHLHHTHCPPGLGSHNKPNVCLFVCVVFFFSCFAALPRISSAMLNRSGERGHLFCYPKIGKEEFGFSLLRMFSALVFFHRNSYWVQEAPFSTWLLKLFIMNGCSTLLSVFFRLYWYDVVFLL